MRSQFIIIFSIIIVLYAAAGYYSGLFVLRFFNRFIASGYTPVFWLVWAAMAILPLASTFFKGYFTGNLAELFKVVGYYWLAVIYYLTLTLLIIDVVFFAGRKFLLFEEILRDSHRAILVTGILLFAWVGLLLIYGTYNAKNVVVNNYDLTIAKTAGDMSSLRAVLVTDTHFGHIVDESRLENMITIINGLNPDIVFLAGDIIEENPNYFTEHKMGEQFQRINPKFGIYAVLGNHEYIGTQAEEIVKCLKDAGIFVLRDEYVKVGDNFYIVGRDDVSLERFTGEKRRELADIMKDVDRSLPVILLDHQPFFLAEAQEQGVDLQMSGHTHRGQLFPNNFITGLIYENDWGHLKKWGFQSIVSAGFGTWGPPIRIGNSPEIVDINIQFAK